MVLLGVLAVVLKAAEPWVHRGFCASGSRKAPQQLWAAAWDSPVTLSCRAPTDTQGRPAALGSKGTRASR